jgi:drug/metabolite transporter (DMT)-like permease
LLLIGSAAPVAALVREIPVLVGQGLRYAAAAMVMIIALGLTGRLRSLVPRVGDLARIGLLGLVGIAGFTVCYVTATFHADPALVGSALAATPVLLAVIGPLQERRRPAPLVVVGAAVVAAGTLLAAGGGSTTALGLVLTLGALAGEVAFTLFAVKLIERYGPIATTLYAAIAGGAVLLLAGLIIDGPRSFMIADADRGELAALAYLAIMVSIGANLAWFTALPRIGPDRAGLFYAFVPVGALLAGLVLGISTPTGIELAGIAVMIVGLLTGLVADLACRRRAARAPEAAPAGRRQPCMS